MVPQPGHSCAQHSRGFVGMQRWLPGMLCVRVVVVMAEISVHRVARIKAHSRWIPTAGWERTRYHRVVQGVMPRKYTRPCDSTLGSTMAMKDACRWASAEEENGVGMGAVSYPGTAPALGGPVQKNLYRPGMEAGQRRTK